MNGQTVEQLPQCTGKLEAHRAPWHSRYNFWNCHFFLVPQNETALPPPPAVHLVILPLLCETGHVNLFQQELGEIQANKHTRLEGLACSRLTSRKVVGFFPTPRQLHIVQSWRAADIPVWQRRMCGRHHMQGRSIRCSRKVNKIDVLQRWLGPIRTGSGSRNWRFAKQRWCFLWLIHCWLKYLKTSFFDGIVQFAERTFPGPSVIQRRELKCLFERCEEKEVGRP